MKKLLVFTIIFCTCLSFGATSKKSGALIHAETYQYKGINGEFHDIEVHFPNKEEYTGPRPCVVFFHGGGWNSGDLAQFRPMSKYFATRGMVAITANYSMHTEESQSQLEQDESRKTICVVDGKSVIRWVKNNATMLGVDSSKLVAGGASAGAHISVLSMMDTEHNNPGDSLGISTDIKAFILFCPAFSLLEKDKTPEVNVFNHLEKPFPPVLFIVGETDNWQKASAALAGDLVKKGNKLEYWMAKDQGHMFHRNGAWVDVTIKKADKFLVSLGLLEGQSPLADPATEERLESIDFVSTGSWYWKPINTNEFKISPNPVTDFLRFHSIEQILNYEIVDLAGTSVMSGITNKEYINLNQLSPGIYVMNVAGYKSKKFYKK